MVVAFFFMLHICPTFYQTHILRKKYTKMNPSANTIKHPVYLYNIKDGVALCK